MKPTDLPPCPACGGKARRVYDPDDSRHLDGYVECTQCGLRTKWGTRIGEAVKTWKKRVHAKAVVDAARTIDSQLPPPDPSPAPVPPKANAAPVTVRRFFKSFALARIGLMMVAEQLDEAFSVAALLFGNKAVMDAMDELKSDTPNREKKVKATAKAKAPATPPAKAPEAVKVDAKAPTKAKPAAKAPAKAPDKAAPAPAPVKKSAKKGGRK